MATKEPLKIENTMAGGLGHPSLVHSPQVPICLVQAAARSCLDNCRGLAVQQETITHPCHIVMPCSPRPQISQEGPSPPTHRTAAASPRLREMLSADLAGALQQQVLSGSSGECSPDQGCREELEMKAQPPPHLSHPVRIRGREIVMLLPQCSTRIGGRLDAQSRARGGPAAAPAPLPALPEVIEPPPWQAPIPVTEAFGQHFQDPAPDERSKLYLSLRLKTSVGKAGMWSIGMIGHKEPGTLLVLSGLRRQCGLVITLTSVFTGASTPPVKLTLIQESTQRTGSSSGTPSTPDPGWTEAQAQNWGGGSELRECDGGMQLSLVLSGAVLKMQFTEGQVAAKPDISDFALRPIQLCYQQQPPLPPDRRFWNIPLNPQSPGMVEDVSCGYLQSIWKSIRAGESNLENANEDKALGPVADTGLNPEVVAATSLLWRSHVPLLFCPDSPALTGDTMALVQPPGERPAGLSGQTPDYDVTQH
ncbi:hypothetical protein MJT46_013946 [Ovis ammon polii x Ovis aries]|nr:hypothetical protein MJT46_013946 [Ovis ammon polii x Ovis aries]